MSGFISFAAEIGHLVLPVAFAAEELHSLQVHIGLGIVVRQVHKLPVTVHGSTLLHLQTVAADMLRLQLQHIFQSCRPAFPGLIGKSVHQIQRKVPKTRSADLLNSRYRLLIAVGTADLVQNFVVIALNAQADPVKTLAAQLTQQLRCDRIGIGLKGDLCVVGNIKAPAYGGQNGCQSVSTKEGGRAAAKIHRIHKIPGRQSAGLFDVGADSIQITVEKSGILGGDGVEITVLTFAPAKRNVDIDPQRGFVFASE